MEESIGFVQIFDIRFLMDFHALGWSQHDLTIFGKCLFVCVSDKNFAASIVRELLHRISRNFIVSTILTLSL